MNYQEFIEDIIETLSKRVESDTTLKVQSIHKNNGLTCEGLIMVRPNRNISPTIYLPPYYHRYLEGVSMEDIYDDILATYYEHLPKNNFDISFFTDFDKVKDSIVMRLVDAKRNESLLEQVPHVLVLDLAIVFCALVSVEEAEQGSILIHNAHLEYWNVDAKMLYPLAVENAQRLQPYYYRELRYALEDMGRDTSDLPYMGKPSMYFLSNEKKIYGASVVLYPGVLENIANEIESDLIMIPSSVHEWLLLGTLEDYEEEIDASYLSMLVKEINETELADDEVLADHIYYYKRGSMEFQTVE